LHSKLQKKIKKNIKIYGKKKRKKNQNLLTFENNISMAAKKKKIINFLREKKIRI